MSNQPPGIGRVYLVGAGPGDPGLITLRGLEKLREADVVLYDGLVNHALHSSCRPQTEWISVGKHGGERIWKQAEIDDELVRHARSGKNVVRLKGGDTGVFARTAEELDRLVREGISFEVVPGITAALAVAAYTGIPLTHRDWSSSLAIVTGQLQPSDGGTEVDEVEDWEALARFPGTLVIYMGVTTAALWSKRLIEGGMSPETPVALVRRCTWPDQETIHSRLSQVAQILTPATRLRPPVLAIIGKVAELGREFDWFSQRPLQGKTILVARPPEQASSTVKQLEELGASVIVQSSVEIAPLEDYTTFDLFLKALHDYAWLVFSSPNGVDHFFERLHVLGMDSRALRDCQIAGVGPSVVAALERWKLNCDLTPDSEFDSLNAVSLAKRLLERLAQATSSQRTLVVRASRGKTTIEDSLRQARYPVDIAVAYRSLDIASLSPAVAERLDGTQVDFVLATSTLIAENLVRLAGHRLRSSTWIAISEEVADAIRRQGYHAIAAKHASIPSMVDSIITETRRQIA